MSKTSAIRRVVKRNNQFLWIQTETHSWWDCPTLAFFFDSPEMAQSHAKDHGGKVIKVRITVEELPNG